ncbi:UDPGP type 1 family protein [Opitutus sp. ER46]|uniref:UTP--glucose-1-phosphate uridylyltransferase n=1 Tax=Opitutus sp. ER46 TaxID=2161864 RepID=UPI000D2F58E2|nr:UDPGP type 1 family protein [Opitutus sp. ER46]PTX91177.1 2-alkenal reductase [Opitutus sp. ER46]
MATNHPLIEKFQQAGQGQVFAYFDELSPEAQRQLLAEAAEIDLAEVERLSRTLLAKGAAAGVNLEGLTPAPYEKRPEHGGDAAAWAKAKAAGEAALRAGRVAAFTVAGGQGTRLGYDGPKGTFPVTPVRRKTLFQVFAEKIRAAGVRYGKPLHWFIMTSHVNHAATEAFFTANQCFGLDRDHVHFFRQGRMPAVGFDGKILLEGKGTIALSPDGHGGSLRALERSGALDLMQREGVDILSYFQVDNPLIRIIDPAFIGWHVLGASEMSSKMVPKAFPEEKVGHFCVQQGRRVVIEYSDLPLAMQREKGPDGQLRYLAGSIAIHLLDREFVRRMARVQPGVAEGNAPTLPFHRADKKIPTLDATGRPVKPEKPNGVKFEMFVFDALPFARQPVIIETRREDDFSPVKNAEGVDSPKTCRDDQLRQFARWLKANAATVTTDATGLPAVSLEVSPLFGYDEDSFADAWRKLAAKPAITEGLYLE